MTTPPFEVAVAKILVSFSASSARNKGTDPKSNAVRRIVKEVFVQDIVGWLRR